MPGQNSGTYGVQVRQLLFFGGAVFAWSLGATLGGPFASFTGRVDTWLNPFGDAQKSGYQLV